MNKVKAIIFDLDGTIIDSIQDLADSMNIVLQRHGYTIHDVPSYIKWIGNGARLLLQRATPQITDQALTEKLLAEFIEVYTENYNKKTNIYHGMEEYLDFLVQENIPIAILTNKPHAETQKIAAHYLTKWPFQYILGQREGIPKKPDPQVALQMASDLHADPSEMLFIGDSATDIKTAVASGMKAIGVSWGYGTNESMKEAGADHLVDTVNELYELVQS